MKVAVIGAGISGLVCSYLLSRRHEVEVFEANSYIGGHTHTHDVTQGGQSYAIDSGFIVFNEHNYPNFTKLLQRLGVPYQDTGMSFSVRCDESGLEYNGTDFNGLFAQRRNLLRPGFYRMLSDILRFGREAPALLETEADPSLWEFVADRRYSQRFREHYLLPMASALWSAPFDTIREFSARSIVEFFQNHGMLQVSGRPQWKVVTGGSREYVRKIVEPFQRHVHLNTPVRTVLRKDNGVQVILSDGRKKDFDHVVLATHSNQSLRMLGDATDAETSILGAIPYQKNDVSLHTDASVLPKRRRAWASWNYRIPHGQASHATATYNMNMLQSVRSRSPFCVTLNGDSSLAPKQVLKRMNYEHPIFFRDGVAAQGRYREIGGKRTHFCGAYWGHGFHEDGVVSALRVCRDFGEEL
ncbi:MAG: FAD-dependent oxidoreductase [Planctomycetota bacterium]